MRFVVVGAGDDGRSTVLEIRHVGVADGARETLWATDRLPPARRDGNDDAAELVEDLGVGPQGTRWFLVNVPANRPGSLHRTDTLDHDVVISGEVTLVLEAGEVTLGPGDAVVIPGVVHGWRTGERACTFSALVIGLPTVS